MNSTVKSAPFVGTISEKKDKTAKQLASAHSSSTQEIEEIYYITSASDKNPQEPVKLLEVNSSTLEVGIQPVCFSATANVPFSSIVVEVSPMEFKAIKAKKTTLPRGWNLGKSLYKRQASHQRKER